MNRLWLQEIPQIPINILENSCPAAGLFLIVRINLMPLSLYAVYPGQKSLWIFRFSEEFYLNCENLYMLSKNNKSYRVMEDAD
ncbi:hypothetical protein FNU76_05525 [Chitinimonas arctica]|uniref:Uncharacterized protein n=1 Tax=Chitinimonas arctica TaxID=2594795 RepID=A0A516SCH6_9NEIS|nr:hypothetical protein [Chitinimonas arctica]QDQ25851.1 hypothetical protein FNU76_05525 [Chitinimonas arctica]